MVCLFLHVQHQHFQKKICMKPTTCELFFEGIFTDLLPWSSWTKATSTTARAVEFSYPFRQTWTIFLNPKNLKGTTTKDMVQWLIFYQFSLIFGVKNPTFFSPPAIPASQKSWTLLPSWDISLPPLRPTSKRSPSRIMSYLWRRPGWKAFHGEFLRRFWNQKLRKVKQRRHDKTRVFAQAFLEISGADFLFLFWYFVSEP